MKENSDGFDEKNSPIAERNNEKLRMFSDKSILPGCSAVSMSDIARNQRVLTTIAGKSH